MIVIGPQTASMTFNLPTSKNWLVLIFVMVPWYVGFTRVIFNSWDVATFCPLSAFSVTEHDDSAVMKYRLRGRNIIRDAEIRWSQMMVVSVVAAVLVVLKVVQEGLGRLLLAKR